MATKLLIVQCAALSEPPDVPELTWRRAGSVFPAVTCVVQASFRTAAPPASHGMVANGRYFRELAKPMFWEQSSRLVAGRRFWRGFREAGGTVGLLFWQQSLGEDTDMLLSPAPIHKHHGGMIQDCDSQPADLYEQLCAELGRPFKLRQYWGPLATPKVGEWIAEAVAAVLARADAPDLILTYLPTLDYALQRRDPTGGHRKIAASRAALAGQLQRLRSAAGAAGYDLLVFGDYAIAPVRGTVFPNRALREAGLMATRDVRGMLYPDFHTSDAFAVVDHEVAHVYCRDGAASAAKAALAEHPGVSNVIDREAQRDIGLAHPNSGELVIVAEPGRWLAYPWWTDAAREPDYARHVDIHNKPGYDPCELFFGWPPMSVSRDTGKVRGSHGRTGEGREVVWAATFEPDEEPADLVALAAATGRWLEKE